MGQREKTKIISRTYGYHGITLAATSATGMAKYQTMFGPTLPGFIHVHAPNAFRYEGKINAGETVGQAAARDLEETILREGADTIAAFIAEPIQGAGGVIIPPDDYFPLVQAILKKYNILLIVDEVITGFGRTGKMFAIEHFGIEPDILQFAKGVTSGYMPLGGIQISDEIRTVIDNAPADQTWMHGYTYSGHAAACAVGMANVSIIERDGLVARSAELGVQLLDGLEALTEEFPNIVNARGRGLIAGIDVVTNKETGTPDPTVALAICNEAQAQGIRVRPLGNAIAMSPPLTISANEVDIIIQTLGQAIAKVA
jgi:adenosylmethionine-8-amino-7-oxononanoate aminotransferase